MTKALQAADEQGPRDAARLPRDRRRARRAGRGVRPARACSRRWSSSAAAGATRRAARAEPRGAARGRRRVDGGHHEDRLQRCRARRAGRGRGPAGRARARLPRHQALVVEAGARARRRRLPGDRLRPARLRRERQARRRSTRTRSRSSRSTSPRSSTISASSGRTSSVTTGARRSVWATAAFAPERRRPSRRDVGRPPDRVREHEHGAAREVVVHAVVPVRAGMAEQWLTMDDWRELPRVVATIPTSTPCSPSLERNGSLTPGSQLLPRERHAGGARRSAARAAADPGADDGHLELGRLRAARGADGRGSAKYCANTFRYERIDGPGALDAVGSARQGERAAARLPPVFDTGVPGAIRSAAPSGVPGEEGESR